MTERHLALLRPDQVLEELNNRRLAYLPVGLCEWHGPHLPFGVDALNAENAALSAAEQTGGLVLPTLYFGTERERSPEMLKWLGFSGNEWIEGMDFPANSLPSMYAREEIMAIAVREQINMAVHFGFKEIVIVSGHAAENQLAVLDRLVKEYNAAGTARLLLVLPFVANRQGVMEVGHASKIETSVMLALQPQTVDLSKLPPAGEPLLNAAYAVVDYMTFLGHPTPDRTVPLADDPRQATAETGWDTIQKAVAEIVLQVNSMTSQDSQNGG
jgi:creatinine amidohydrolase